MDERDRILEDLQRWVKQQQRAGQERLLFHRDFHGEGLGAGPAAAAPSGGSAPGTAAQAAPVEAVAAPKSPAPTQTSTSTISADPDSALAQRHPAWRGTELMPLAEQIDACRACNLAVGRANTVPGVGNPRAKLAFVGEAPGAEEDRQGIPFVGRAGQLLDKILAAIELKRADVHILNILKCRPPENRNPAPDEIAACAHFLERQIQIIQPGILVALGLFAGQWLTGRKMSLTKLRETGPYEYMGIPVYATYHPAALLRNPNWKRPAWEDFKIIQREYRKL